MLAPALYVVATPIGNFEDLSPRALRVLKEVNVIAAEDTRHSARLMAHFSVKTPMLAYHDHNERERSSSLLDRIVGGESMALISDAGTPLVSDPGFVLVREARKRGIQVIPVPGPSAIIAALSAAGLPSDRFFFEGFLSAKTNARCERIRALAEMEATWIVYESSHRIVASLKDMREVLGEEREIVVARELTKTFETIHGGTLQEVITWIEADHNQQKGEFVVLVKGAPKAAEDAIPAETLRVLDVLLEELSVKQASALAAKICGLKKKALYQIAMERKG